jgi:hypothetical protein
MNEISNNNYLKPILETLKDILEETTSDDDSLDESTTFNKNVQLTRNDNDLDMLVYKNLI